MVKISVRREEGNTGYFEEIEYLGWDQLNDNGNIDKIILEGIYITILPEEKLPELPEDYSWEKQIGGLRFESNKAITYRLWNIKLGYCPASE